MAQSGEAGPSSSDTAAARRPGEASIKAEYLIQKKQSNSSTKNSNNNDDAISKKAKLSEEPAADTKVSETPSEMLSTKTDNERPQDGSKDKDKKEKQRGRNKIRPGMARQPPGEKLCPVLKDVLESEPEPQCGYQGRCHFLHDPAQYAASKPADLGPDCYMFTTHGRCPSGLTCRFGGAHLTATHQNRCGDADLWRAYQESRPSRNLLQKDVQRRLWKRKYDFSASAAAVRLHDRRPQAGGSGAGPNGAAGTAAADGAPASDAAPDMAASATASTTVTAAAADGAQESVAAADTAPSSAEAAAAAPAAAAAAGCEGASDAAAASDVVPAAAAAAVSVVIPVLVESPDGAAAAAAGAGPETAAGAEPKPVGPHSDADLVRLRQPEKRKVLWKDQLYLAPLTTVGNLPFRRLCRRLGADITCGEMAMAANLLQGSMAEWALVRRHHSETVFGAQICGNNPALLTRCSQLLNETCELDFIDINLGCPIEMVYAQGSGSAMMRKRGMLENTCRSIAGVVDVPLTLKMRTGVQRGVNLAKGLLCGAADWGVDMVTLHGRSREQRYTKLADWSYLAECARAAAPLPVFGNGDVLSWEEYEAKRAASGVAGIMVARGALIKPWIFTEIKERRTWDIRSSERLDILREYTNYGLEHWGSDTEGVEKTRRFLLEWLSFLHRYIPAGLLEAPPQRINERPPAYRGRDELETLMASGNCRDWIAISEMLLGKVPENFEFLPKHKASSYN